MTRSYPRRASEAPHAGNTGSTTSNESHSDSQADDRFSDQLEAWLERDEPKTIGSLTDLIDEKSFAVVLLLLLIPSALPIPTGGVTHVLELIAVVVVAQMVFGREELWLPRRFRTHELGETMTGKAIPRVLGVVRWFERWSRPRLSRLLDLRPVKSLLAVFLLVFVAGALFAPPFSGLDTLPALGVVIACLGIIFSDAIVVLSGLVVGAAGIALVILLGTVAWSFL
jgi:hypothetical protein